MNTAVANLPHRKAQAQAHAQARIDVLSAPTITTHLCTVRRYSRRIDLSIPRPQLLRRKCGKHVELSEHVAYIGRPAAPGVSVSKSIGVHFVPYCGT